MNLYLNNEFVSDSTTDGSTPGGNETYRNMLYDFFDEEEGILYFLGINKN